MTFVTEKSTLKKLQSYRMKKLFVLVLLFLIFPGTAFAKGGSGGQLPTAPAASLDQPAASQPTNPPGAETAPAAKEEPKAVSKPALTPSGTSAPPAEKKKSLPPQKEPEKAAPKPAVLLGKKHCGQLEKLEDRIKCRFGVSEEVLKEELKTAYFPEGCRRGKPEWQEACKARYKAIGPCWYLEQTAGDKYPAKKIYSCLKKELKLADELKPVKSYCKDKDASCAEEYQKSVYNLIISRFYDAEQRAEDLRTQGRLSDEDTQAFIVFISRQKLAFYDAQTKAERVKIIQDVGAEWQKLLKKLK